MNGRVINNRNALQIEKQTKKQLARLLFTSSTGADIASTVK